MCAELRCGVYWCDPALGINVTGAHLIGITVVALGARGSGRSHAVVRCPTPWFPTFVNGGHECLLVRVWDETSDGLGDPPWDASLNRHVGQRNIHVVAAGDQAMHALARLADQPLLLPAPVNLQVGPLFGEPAEVAVKRAAPNEMAWLQLRTGIRGQFPAQAAPTGNVLLGTPTTIGGGPSTTGAATTHQVVGDDQQITFTTGDAMPPPGQAHVYRVTASQQGQVFGGYTIVLLGAPTTIGGGPSTTGAAPAHQVVGDDQQITFTTGDATPPPGQAHVYRVTASQQGQIFGGYTVVLLG